MWAGAGSIILQGTPYPPSTIEEKEHAGQAEKQMIRHKKPILPSALCCIGAGRVRRTASTERPACATAGTAGTQTCRERSKHAFSSLYVPALPTYLKSGEPERMQLVSIQSLHVPSTPTATCTPLERCLVVEIRPEVKMRGWMVIKD